MTREKPQDELNTVVAELTDAQIADLLRQAREMGAAQRLNDAPRDEWERRVFAIPIETGVSLPDHALTSEGLYPDD